VPLPTRAADNGYCRRNDLRKFPSRSLLCSWRNLKTERPGQVFEHPPRPFAPKTAPSMPRRTVRMKYHIGWVFCMDRAAVGVGRRSRRAKRRRLGSGLPRCLPRRGGSASPSLLPRRRPSCRSRVAAFAHMGAPMSRFGGARSGRRTAVRADADRALALRVKQHSVGQCSAPGSCSRTRQKE